MPSCGVVPAVLSPGAPGLLWSFGVLPAVLSPGVLSLLWPFGVSTHPLEYYCLLSYCLEFYSSVNYHWHSKVSVSSLKNT